MVDTPEAFLETFELEQGAGPVYLVSLGGGAVLFTFQRFAVPLVSEEAGPLRFSWENGDLKRRRRYTACRRVPPAMVRYAQEHHCLGRRSLARCEAASEVSVADDQGRQGTVAVDEALGSLWTAAEWREPLVSTILGPLCPAVPVGVLYVTFWPDTGDVKNFRWHQRCFRISVADERGGSPVCPCAGAAGRLNWFQKMSPTSRQGISRLLICMFRGSGLRFLAALHAPPAPASICAGRGGITAGTAPSRPLPEKKQQGGAGALSPAEQQQRGQ